MDATTHDRSGGPFDTSLEMPPHGGQRVATAGAPIDQASIAVVLLHGRGCEPEDVLTLADAYTIDGVCYVAPAAAQNAWYPALFSSGEKSNAQPLESAHAVIEAILSTLARHGLPPERCVLAGFSQGACVVLDHALAHPRRYGLLVAYAGAVPGTYGAAIQPHGHLDGTPVDLSCGQNDPFVSSYKLDQTARALRAMGAEVDVQQHPGLPHTMCRAQIDRTREHLGRLLAHAEAAR